MENINKFRTKINADSHHTKSHKQLKTMKTIFFSRWCRKWMNYPFLLETRHIPGVIQISGENKGVNSHIVEVKLMWGQAPLVGVSCFVLLGLLLPDISTGAAMQPVGLWGPFLGLAVVGVAGGRWEMQDETSRSFGDHENSLSFRKAENWSLDSCSTCGRDRKRP